jgi:hypothetical protein
MHIHKLDLTDWVRMDYSYIESISNEEKLELIFMTTDWDSTRLAKDEFLKLLIEHLITRFPDKLQPIFQSSDQIIAGIRNVVLMKNFK